MILTIKGRLAGLNEYTNACRRNRYAGAQMKKNAEILIKYSIYQQLRDVHFNAPVRMSFRWYEANQKRDLDNICFAKKFILDALVQSNVIENDNWKHIKGFTDEFFVDKENPRIEVEIDYDDESLPF